MTPLEARQATKQAILLTIQRREELTTAALRRLTYAQAVQQQRSSHQNYTPNPYPPRSPDPTTPTATDPPPSKAQGTPNHRINGCINTPLEPTPQILEPNNKMLRQEGWTLVTRRKNRTFHQNNTQPITLNTKRDHAWLLQQRRCFKCFLKGHQKQHCNRTIRCLQCNQEGHISKHCINSINGGTFTVQEPSKSEAPLANGEKPRQIPALFTGREQDFASFLLQQHTSLLQQGRCLKCFLRGHTKQQCTRLVKCFQCNKAGHTAKRCKLSTINAKSPNGTTHPIKVTTVQPQHTQPTNRVPNSATNQLKHMENVTNWEIMDLMDPDDFEDGRRESLRVFLPPRSALRPINSFLERSALVLAGPHQINRYVAHRLAVTLANYFNMQPRDFPISRVHQNYGDFLVRFPNTNLRDQAVAVCAFTLGPNMHLQLVKWTPGMGGIYDPVTHKARLRLYGLPNHNWNIHDLDILVSGFGHLFRVEPFYSTGNHQEIRILVGCFHPINIPRTIDLSEEPHSCIVHVVIEGWMHDGTAPIPRDVTNVNDDEDPFGGPTDGRRRQHNVAHQTNQQRRDNATGSNSPDPGNHGRNGNRQVQQHNLLERSLEVITVRPNGGNSIMDEIETGEQKASEIYPYVDLMFCLLFKSMALYEKSKRNSGIKCTGQELACVHLFGAMNAKAGLTTPTILTEGTRSQQHLSYPNFLPSQLDSMTAQAEIRTGPTIVEIIHDQQLQGEDSTPLDSPPGYGSQQAQEGINTTGSPPLGFEIQQAQEGNTSPRSPPPGFPNQQAQDGNSTPESLLLGPPPGFEGRQNQQGNRAPNSPPLAFKGHQPQQEAFAPLNQKPGFDGRLPFTGQTRRSPRLLEKHSGKYVSILQRAQHIRGNNKNGENAVPNRKKHKIGPQLQPSYQQDSSPLTVYQAEAVLAQAGITLDEGAMEAIKEKAAVPLSGPQEVTV
ncbi:hypothetical protein FCM35_KLT10226 [Carex littledalei]|uniref:CCHC-type domain-containing protein n=1 Tax=Carex littledalei TaxID=544730 RepID=A0A833VGD5_9POAL|nr:hypothetical protein FCM35_KLT10226 [Carex littledalei]